MSLLEDILEVLLGVDLELALLRLRKLGQLRLAVGRVNPLLLLLLLFFHVGWAALALGVFEVLFAFLALYWGSRLLFRLGH